VDTCKWQWFCVWILNARYIGQAAEKNLGARVIYDLMKDLEEIQHNMYFDSYVTYVAFVKALKDKKGIHVSGTEERKSVGMPKNFVCVSHMWRGNSDDRSTNSAIAATLWKYRLQIFIKNTQETIEKKWTQLKFFLEFTKAYDVLNHKVLLSKLNSYGIKGVANLWFEYYLSHQKQCVEINSMRKGIYVLTTREIDHGVHRVRFLVQYYFHYT